MRDNYTCVFLRKAIVVPNPAAVQSLQLSFVIDDGMIVWLNGTQVRNAAGPANPAYTNSATSSREAPYGGQTSRAMVTSEFSAACTSTLVSGVRRCEEPSR